MKEKNINSVEYFEPLDLIYRFYYSLEHSHYEPTIQIVDTNEYLKGIKLFDDEYSAGAHFNHYIFDAWGDSRMNRLLLTQIAQKNCFDVEELFSQLSTIPNLLVPIETPSLDAFDTKMFSPDDIIDVEEILKMKIEPPKSTENKYYGLLAINNKTTTSYNEAAPIYVYSPCNQTSIDASQSSKDNLPKLIYLDGVLHYIDTEGQSQQCDASGFMPVYDDLTINYRNGVIHYYTKSMRRDNLDSQQLRQYGIDIDSASVKDNYIRHLHTNLKIAFTENLIEGAIEFIEHPQVSGCINAIKADKIMLTQKGHEVLNKLYHPIYDETDPEAFRQLYFQILKKAEEEAKLVGYFD